MLFLIEGPRNCGKSHLVSNCSVLKQYKFPFVEYFSMFMASGEGDTGNGNEAAFHMTAGYDLTALSMNQAGLVSSALLDRSFLSNVVLGEIQGRIPHQTGVKYIDYLVKRGLLQPNLVRIVYLTAPHKKDERGKDNWDFLGRERQEELFDLYLAQLKDCGVTAIRMENQFDVASQIRFDLMVGQNIVSAMPKQPIEQDRVDAVKTLFNAVSTIFSPR